MSTSTERRQRRQQALVGPGPDPVPGEVWLVLEWGCSCDQDCCDGTPGFYAVCGTKQLAEQVLDAQGGHSFGTVRKQQVSTTMRQARGY